MKTDSHDKETDPAEKLSMPVNLDKGIESVTQLIIISYRKRKMGCDCKPSGERK